MNLPVSIDNLTKSYSDGMRRKRKILHGISLDVQPHEIFGFIGPNGAGKSTAINLVMGFTQPDAGTVKVNGLTPDQSQSRRFVGYLPEGPRFYENLTAEELLVFAAKASSMDVRTAKKAIDPLLDMLSILHVKKHHIKTYSKGMKQRIGLALALIHDPKILILDEPMSGLDPLGRNQLKRIIIDLKARGKTIFFSSHILNDVETLCDRIAVIHQGRILFCGETKDFSDTSGELENKFVNIIQATKEHHAIK
ncbi:MAG: ABC transporter ATP-binding protein [Desulfobacteraceae bacterium]|nr:ABC transporter ATP-binding protein [Desulfobacteraceae bacterium]